MCRCCCPRFPGILESQFCWSIAPTTATTAAATTTTTTTVTTAATPKVILVDVIAYCGCVIAVDAITPAAAAVSVSLVFIVVIAFVAAVVAG